MNNLEYALKNRVNNLIEENQIVVFWNDQNIDIYNLLFSDNLDFELIDYYVDDRLLTNYTKLLSFFSSNIELNENIQKYELSNTQNDFINIFKFIIYLLKKCYYYFTHRDYLRILRKFSNYHFTNQEINLMTKIYAYSKKHDKKEKQQSLKNINKIIVINNINYANELDIIFIKKLINSNFFRLFAKKIKFIILSNSSSILDTKLKSINKNNVLKIVFTDDELCHYIKNTYNDIKISNEKLKQYLKLCNNDFNLVNSIIQSSQIIDIDVPDNHNIIKLKEIIFDILERFPQLSVLEIAAIIGLSFDLTILKDIADIEVTDLIGKLNDAYNQGLLIKNNSNYNYEFISNFIRHIIYTHGTSKSRWHKKYAEKINSISPDEHALIANHFYKGNDYKSAILHYWAYLLTSAIDGKPSSETKKSLQEILYIIKKTLSFSAINLELENLLNNYREYKLTKNLLISSLKDVKNSDFYKMLNYAKQTIIYLSKYTTNESEFLDLAVALEKSYKFLEDNRILGLQIRCGLYLMDIYSYRLNNPEGADRIKEKLNHIVKDILYTPNLYANNFENQSLVLKLIRKTSVQLNAETAYIRTKNTFFSFKDRKNMLNEIELYKFISDHIGYGLYSGFYNDISREILKEAKKYIELGKQFNYPKIYKLRINYFLYNLFNNQYTISDIKNFLREEKKHIDVSSSMYRYNIAAIALYCSQFNYAEKILLELHAELSQRDTCFYSYCYNANLASLYLLMKEYDKANHFNNLILENDYDWAQDFIKIMKFRAEKFKEFILNQRTFSAKQLFDCFADIPFYTSDTWRFLGKGIIFSELMFYRE